MPPLIPPVQRQTAEVPLRGARRRSPRSTEAVLDVRVVRPVRTEASTADTKNTAVHDPGSPNPRPSPSSG